MAKLMGTLITLGALVALSSGSAIPMWEFLSRAEKSSHLYSMFAKQVSAHCKSSANEMPVNKCKHTLLTHGIGRLENMSDDYMNAMDPYQRGVNDLIWDSMVEGHYTRPSKRVHHATSSPIREPTGPYERNPLFDDISPTSNIPNRFPESNANNLNSNDNRPLHHNKDNNVQQQPQPQPQHLSAAASNTQYADAMEMEMLYGASASGSVLDHQYVAMPAATNVHVAVQPTGGAGPYLSGPMIIRVRPDGTPVEEDGLRQLPRDDDREAMTIGAAKLPTVQQIDSEFASGALAGRSIGSNHYRSAQRLY